MKNKILFIADFIFLFHVFWVLYVLGGLLFKYPGFLWDLHLLMSLGLLIGVILNECPLTSLERYVRKKGGQKLVNRGSRFLEVFEKMTGIKLPNNLMRILGFLYFLIGIMPHLVKY
ncbi:MAG: DUF2784 family protein [Candidatus Aenigmatarchaeota archaeon]|nr:DUF2784 family protein [Candidatus Aenigmarchaeota archaeon]